MVSREVIDSISSLRTLSDADYPAFITCGEGEACFAPAVTRDVLLRMWNGGKTQWPGGVRLPTFIISYHLLDKDNSVIAFDGRRTSLSSNLASRHSLLALAYVGPYMQAGRHALPIDWVHEHVRWIGQKTRDEIEVSPRPLGKGH